MPRLDPQPPKRRPWITAAAFSALLDIPGRSLRIAIDPSMDPLVATNDPERQFYEQMRLRFSGSGVLTADNASR